MAFTKIILTPIRDLVMHGQLPKVFTKYGIVARCIYVSSREESSFHQYNEGSAIIEFDNERDALIAWEAAQNGEIKFNGETLTAVHFYEDYSPIEKLPDNCLKTIFSMLPVSYSLNAEKVCERWNKIVSECSYRDTKLDIRDFFTFEDAEKCIAKYGSSVKEVYYTVNCPISLLGEYCDNLENLIIDYEGNAEFCDKRDVDLRSAWRPFKTLARVKLKNVGHYDSDFLIYLPETVMELQLVNSSDTETCCATLIDLQNLPNLRALKLVGFTLNDGLLLGFDQLKKKLHYLFIESCKLSYLNQQALAWFANLVYLALKNLTFDDSAWAHILDNSENLQYLDISYLRNSAPNLFLSPESLRYLKYLLITQIQSDDLSKLSVHRLPNLKYLDCQQSPNVNNRILCKFIQNSHHLTFLNASGCNITSRAVKAIESITKRRGRAVLKLFLGKNVRRVWGYPADYSSHLILGEEPKGQDVISQINKGWYTKNYEIIIIISPDLPLLDDSTPIETLPTECLSEIFSYLSMDDRLIVEEVCPRWKAIVLSLWRRQTKFDIRDLRYPEDAEKCVKRCGEKLEKIYYYKEHGLSVISKYCRDVKKVRIDFQDRMYDGEKRREKPDIPDLQPTLLELKNLTSLTLQHVDRNYNYDFLKDLPATITELHILSEGEYSKADIDIGKFANLNALTLNNFEYTVDGDCALIRGFETLENLKYLCLEMMNVIRMPSNPLRYLKKLEYLSLCFSRGFQANTIVSVLKNNRNLKYLNLTSFTFLTKATLRAISNLRHLRTLHLSDQYNDLDSGEESDDTYYDDNDEDNGEVLPDQPLRGMPSLEYFNYGCSRMIEPSALMKMISSSPNLKLLVVLSDQYDAQQIYDAADRATSHRTDENYVKIILGDRAEVIDDDDETCVLAYSQLEEDEWMVFEIEFNEWYLKNRAN